MIRANNYGVVLGYFQYLSTQLTRLLAVEYLIAILLLSAVLIRVVVRQVQIGLFCVAWMAIEWASFAGIVRKRKKIIGWPEPTEIAVRKWRLQVWNLLLIWRFLKLMGFLFCLLYLMESREALTITMQTLYHIIPPMLFLILSLLTLHTVNRMLFILKNMNRVFNNFECDFGQDENFQSNLDKYQHMKILQGLY